MASDRPGDDTRNSESHSVSAGHGPDAQSASDGDSDNQMSRDERLGGSVQTGRPERFETPQQVDWRGWLLVALVVLSFVVIPLFVLYIPEAHWLIGRLGFSQRQAYIIFPMLPAILLALTAVWAAVRTHSE